MSFTGVVFLLLFCGGLGMAILRHPIYGLYLYVAVFYLDPTNRWWGGSLPDLRWSLSSAAVTLLATLIHRRRGRVPIYSHAPVWLFFCYVLWMFVRSPWAVAPQDNWYEVTIYAKYLVAIYLIYALVDSKRHMAGFLMVHAMGCLYLGVLAWSTGADGRLDGIGGPGINDANSMAMQLATGVYAAAAYYFAEKRWRRWLVVAVVPFALNGLVMSGSRGGFLAILAGGFAFYLFRPFGQIRRVLPYAVFAVLLLGYVASATFIERMSTLTEPVTEQADDDLSVATRLMLFKVQWQMVLDHPFGVGGGGTAALSYSYLDPKYLSGAAGRSSHNSIMSALVDQGFPGVILWLAIVWSLVKRIRINRRWCNRRGDVEAGWLSAGVAAMFVVVFVAGLFSPQQRTEVYFWVLALACAFVPIMQADSRMRGSNAAMRSPIQMVGQSGQ